MIFWSIFNLQLYLQWCILYMLCFIDSTIYFMYDIFVYFIFRFYKNRTVCFYYLTVFKTHIQCQCDSSMLLWRVCHVQMCLLGGSPCEAVVFPGGQIEGLLVSREPLSVLTSLKALMVGTISTNRDPQKAFESNVVNGDTQMWVVLNRWCIGDREWS